MRIGVPKEIKTHEYRVGLTPAGVRELVIHGHQVTVERNAAAGIGIGDDAYRAAGATVVDTAAEVFAIADLIVKVKEPQPAEIAMLRQGQVLFTYLHLAADKAQTEGLMHSGATCIAYETVTDRVGRAAAAGADERGRRAHVGAGRRALPGEGAGRRRRSARRRAGRGAGEGRGARRRRVGHQRRARWRSGWRRASPSSTSRCRG